MAGLMDVMLGLIVPLNQGLQGITPAKVERLLDGADGGALHRRGDRVDLDTEILLQGFPAFGQPLAALAKTTEAPTEREQR